jgi:hypothetical protein
MKIVSSPISPAEKPGVEESAPPPKAVVKPRIFEVDPDTAPASQQDREQIQQIARDVASLTHQVAALRKTITDIQKIAEAAAAVKEPPPKMMETPLEKKVEPPASGVAQPEKQVAFLGKLWDYFNETARKDK